jgi:hypothetical protein
MDAYTDLLDKYRFDPEWTYVGRGQNGSVYRKGDITIKITTDEVELEHAKQAEGKTFSSLNPISNVEVHSPNLGTYQSPFLSPVPSQVKDAINKKHQEITEYIETKDESLLEGLPTLLQKFYKQVRIDFQKAGIPLDETDIQGDNVMVDSKGKLKMIDY